MNNVLNVRDQRQIVADVELLYIQMAIQMENLDNNYNEENIQAFFVEIATLQQTINSYTETTANSTQLQQDKSASSERLIHGERRNGNGKVVIDGQFAQKSLLPIYYNNVRSITNKRNICMQIELSFYKVFVLTETWLTSDQSSSVYFPKQFNVYRYDKVVGSHSSARTRRSRGVAVLVHGKLASRQIRLAQESMCECLAIEIKVKPTPLIIYAVYMNEFTLEVAMKHFDLIDGLMTKFKQHRVIVVGDFNLHNIGWTADEQGTCYLPSGNSTHDSSYHNNAREFLRKMESAPLFQLSNIENAASNVLDLLFVNDTGDVRLCQDQHTIIDIDQQDVFHKPYEITFEYCDKNAIPDNEQIETYCYKRGNYRRICQQLSGINFQHEFESRDVEKAFEYFYYTMNRLISNNVPKIKVKNQFNKPKWWTPQLQSKKNRRDKTYKRKPSGIITKEYLVALKEFNDLNKRLHKEYIDRVQREIKSNPSEFWKFAKLTSKSSLYPTEMYYGDKNGSSPKAIVELFAEFFESIYSSDEQEGNFSHIFREQSNSRELNVTLFDIERAIDSLKWRGSMGPDELSSFVIKMCAEAITWPLWLLFQKTFTAGVIPDKLKMSRVVPVFKKGEKADIVNYRMIAISSVLLKIFERAMKFKLNIIIEPQLTNSQHGFRSRRSVTTNLMNLSIHSHEALHRGNQVDVFYGDFKNAFDKVWHRRLIEKLSKFSIGNRTAKWLFEFLIGRTNYVQIGVEKSRKYLSRSGVPAGSTLGPVLFSIFINDLVESVQKAKVLLYADDVKLVKEVFEPGCSILLQNDIDSVVDWCNENRLYFNKQKCAIFTISRARTIIEAKYTIADHDIERKNEIRDLGVLLDQRLLFTHHIEQVTARARQLIGYIKRVSNGNFTMQTQKILYLSYVRSRLEFASVIWNPYQQIYKDDIESIQRQFVMYLLESRKRATSFRLAPYNERCKSLNIQPLELRRSFADATFAYDVFVSHINDDFIHSKFIRSRSTRLVRNNRILEEQLYRHDYLRYQPLARLRHIINVYNAIVTTSDGNRSVYKSSIVKLLTVNNGVD